LRELERKLASVLQSASWIESQDDSRFPDVALTSFRHQIDRIPAYRAYVDHLGVDSSLLSDWQRIPPVPASAFKTHDLSAAPLGAEAAIFETSGTTISRPGRVRLRTTALYEASLLANARRHLLPDGARLPAVVFGPHAYEAPHSSLWFMVDRMVKKEAKSGAWLVRDGTPRWDLADQILEEAASSEQPVLLLGTTLLFMAYFERLASADRRFRLPPGSRAMDTGGAKGLRTEFSRSEVAQAFANRLGIPETHLVNEYGMAELGSQFYDDNLAAAVEKRPRAAGKRIPPWVRTRALDPETLREVPEGTPGILVHYDLVNLDTPLAIQTEDIGTRVGNRLTIAGRLPEAEARGCSLAFEEFVEQERRAGGRP
jgi:acyl-CoA synthetase (AMP-forming)/AMP-acid ligase II